MIIVQESLRISTQGRGSYDITRRVQQKLQQCNIQTGMCNLFLQHTSASIILCENADPTVREDLERFMLHLVPDGDDLFQHSDEGPDDMPAHIRSILTKNDLAIPITAGKLNLGIWQGIYLWEHRHHGHERNIHINLMGI